MPDFEGKIRKFALYGAAVLVGTALLWISCKYLIPVLLPFALAWFVSVGVRRASEWLCKKTGKHRSFFAVGIILAGLTGLFCLLWFFSVSAVEELLEAVERLSVSVQDADGPVARVMQAVSDYGDSILNGATTLAVSDLSGMINSMLTSLASFAASWAGGVMSAAPGIVFSFAVFLIALFYFSMQPEKIKREVCLFLPGNTYDRVLNGAYAFRDGLWSYIRAYLLIMVITFAVLLAGFFLIGIDYALLTAALIAVFDILPVVGAGTVIVPWALYSVLCGDSRKGVGLIAVFAVLCAIRQVAEPRLIGKTSGVHPITALFAVFAGARLFGIGGMILAPVLLSAAVSAYRNQREKTGKKQQGKS